jgi:hypothetical protein
MNASNFFLRLAAPLVALLLATSATALADTRSSANYDISTDTLDGGGQPTTGGNYSMSGDITGIGGISGSVSPTVTLNSGYIGQLYQVVGLVILVGPIPTPDPGTRQLSANATLDDGTVLVLSGSTVDWSSPDEPYPIASINTSGLVTPALSLETAAIAPVDGYYLGGTGVLTLSLAPLNSVGDGIPDWWRAAYFPPGNGSTTNNLDCANCDADGTGQDNLLKFLAGLDPTNSLSVFKITSVAKQGTNVLVTWTSVGGHSYVLQSTRSTAMIAGYNTNFADASTDVAVPLAGPPTTNYLDLGAAYASVLTVAGGQMSTTSVVPSTVECSAQYTRGLADSLGQAVPSGSLLMIGTFSISEATIQSNFLAGNLSAIMSAFTPYTNSFAVGNGTGLPASWDVTQSAPGFGGQQIYLLASDKPTLGAATHLGIFTAPSWIFPADGNSTSIDLEDVTDFVIGAQGGSLTIGLGLGQTYTFTDTARLSELPGRMLFYRIRLGP